ncbi:IS4 family transposase ISPa45 [Dyadobacter sp. CECT 9275]|uniref:IS4 family transposase ISPa45 n=2 Tax=Dyadobacter helix TaxID=2822344 RepID=A0A916JFG3_9BACT|nr:IS4 family transposase ISPa45 [Dyadobacter sp. CECT 9275]
MSIRSSLQRDLDSFYKNINQSDFSIRAVTKSAFSQALSKINPLAFKHLSRISLKVFYDKAPVKKWKGMRILACDGTRLILPRHKTISEELGVQHMGPNAEVATHMAMASILYDTENLVPIDSQIAPYELSERDLLKKHLSYTQEGDLLLLDRGYPAQWLFFLLYAKDLQFCIRLSDYNWGVSEVFSRSQLQQTIVQINLPKKDRIHLDRYPEFYDKELSLRLVKVILSTGETEILCTSLLDYEQFPITDFQELYHKRWTAEEAFKMLKSRIQLENFSGKTAVAVRQDFYAKMFAMTLCATHAFPIEERVKAEYQADKRRKRGQKINRTAAVAMLQQILVPAFIRRKFLQALQAFDDLVEKTREIVRPNRSNPRKYKPSKRHYVNYKTL